MTFAFDLQNDKWGRDDKVLQPLKIVSLLDMLDFYADRYLRIYGALTQLTQVIQLAKGTPILLGPSERDELGWLHENLVALGLTNSAIAAKRLLNFIEKSGALTQSEPVHHFLEQVIQRIPDELQGQLALMVPFDKARYYNEPGGVWQESIRGSFSSTEHDMEEAGKCFALGRYTASVFHSMRILEAGLVALGAALDVRVGENWNTALDQIEKEIRSRNRSTHGDAWKNTDEPFYTEAATHFRMVKNAWRNHTMHLKEHYDEERAQGVLNSVSDFMRHLATRLHE
jgi:hypothetical protein